MPRKPNHASSIATGLLMAGSLLPLSAFAQATAEAPPSAREQALEARVAALEAVIAALQAEQQQRAAAAPPAPAAATPAAAPAAPAIQSTPINTAGFPGTRFSFGGFIKMEAVATATDGGELPDGGVARLLYVPGAIPVGGPDEGYDLDASALFSRLWFSSDASLEDGTPLRAYLELDLFGSALGTEMATNTYGVTVRHAWASWGRWMVGQNWSNFQDPASLIDSIDLIGATDATVFVRQPQLRYTQGAWSLALENPETVFSPRGGNFARISSDDNRLPDLTARWTHRGPWGHVSVAGLLRELRHQTTTGIDDASTGFGLSLTGRQIINPANDLRYGVTVGRGISRYIGIAIGPDAILDGGRLEAVDTQAVFAGWRHVVSPKLRTNLYASASFFDNDPLLAGGGAIERVGSVAANLIYSPHPRIDVGLEGRLGRRWLENGNEGDLSRLHFHVRYNF